MEQDILSRIEANASAFSKNQRLLAAYIGENYDKAAFLTAGKLARAVGVSESTVVRFATELGYAGYPEMRRAVQDMVRSRLTAVQRIAAARDTMTSANVLRKVIADDVAMLQSTLEEINHASFDRVVELLAEADNIYIIGSRSSYCLASYLFFYLQILRGGIHLVQDTTMSELPEQLFRVTERDVCLFISYPRYSSRSLQGLRCAREQGASIVALTDNEASPFAQGADIALYAHSEMVSFVDSLTAPMSLLNALIVALGSRSDIRAADTFGRLEGVWSQYEIFSRTE